MGYAMPTKVYEKLGERLGKETATVVTEALEDSIRSAIEDSKDRLKITISEELKKELATKHDLKLLEIDLRKEIELVRKDMKIMEIRITAILIIVMILLNQNSLEFIARLLGLMK